MTLRWIAERLNMGQPWHLSCLLRRNEPVPAGLSAIKPAN